MGWTCRWTKIVRQLGTMLIQVKYSVRLPQELPPSYKGKAFRFSYRLVINIGMPGGNKEIAVPVRVWGAANYDVLQPIIHRLPPQNPIKDEAEETLTKGASVMAVMGG